MSLRIIICEDNAIISLDLKSILHEYGHNVVLSCPAAEEVLEHFKNGFEADLLIADVKLKGEMDGFQLGEEVINVYNKPVIFVTGGSFKQFNIKILTNKKSCFIKKPFDKNDIGSAIEMLFPILLKIKNSHGFQLNHC